MAESRAYVWLDVFAARPLGGGNQLCVFTQADGMTAESMARLTRELGHSETVFLQSPALPGADVRLRIWIPTGAGAMEVPFAGHPILGSACAYTHAPPGRTGEPGLVRCETGVGLVAVRVERLGGGSWEATMEQPLPRLVWSRRAPGPRSSGDGAEAEALPGLAAALGLEPGDLRADLPVEAVDNGMQSVIIPLVSAAAVDRCRPDLARLRELLGRAGLCTLVFAMGGADDGSDLHCRVFSPFDLVVEDPATGSANGPLGEYVFRNNLSSQNVLISEQGDQMGRPSRIRILLQRGADGRLCAIRVAGGVHLMGSGHFQV